MEAIKHVVRTPKNHKIQINIPRHIPENELVEVIMLVGKQQTTFDQKIGMLKSAMHDMDFLDDLHDVAKDFETLDMEDWER